MTSSRLPFIVPILMTMAGLPAGEAQPAPKPPLSGDQEAFWKEFQNGAVSQAQVDAEAKYVTARAEFQNAHFVEARQLVEQAIAIYPSHEGAQKLRQDILAVLSQRDNRLQMAATWFHSIQDVKTQEIAVRLAALMASGDQN